MQAGSFAHTLDRSVDAASAAILSSDLKGTARLAIDATVALTDVVEAMHGNIVRLPGMPADPQPTRTRGLTGLVYRNIRTVSGWVGSGLDAALGGLQPLLDRISIQAVGPARDAVIAALNGLLGDHLAATGNPLATAMTFRRDGRVMPHAEGGRTLLLIHGLCMHDAQWQRSGHDHGAALARDLGWQPAYLRYNSGLHVSTNGRELAEHLERWIDAAPTPVSELAIIGYSLGGLVARSAYHYATLAGHRWPRRLRRLVFLGTPHHGAPLERGGNWIDLALGMTRYSAPLAALGRIRSAGITDLRHGSLLDDDWQGANRFGRDARLPQAVALPRRVRCAALAASTGHRADDLGDRLLGDGLVPVASALGRHDDATRTLGLAADRQWIGYGIHHLDLLSDPKVYAQLKRTLSATRPKRAPQRRPPD